MNSRIIETTNDPTRSARELRKWLAEVVPFAILLSPTDLERGEAIERLCKSGLTVATIAKYTGMSVSRVKQLGRLAALPERIKQYLSENQLREALVRECYHSDAEQMLENLKARLGEGVDYSAAQNKIKIIKKS